CAKRELGDNAAFRGNDLRRFLRAIVKPRCRVKQPAHYSCRKTRIVLEPVCARGTRRERKSRNMIVGASQIRVPRVLGNHVEGKELERGINRSRLQGSPTLRVCAGQYELKVSRIVESMFAQHQLHEMAGPFL